MWTLGADATAGVLTRLGYSCGVADVLTPEFRQPILRGLGQTQSSDANSSSEYIVNISESAESKIAVKFFGKKSEMPQCWLLAGYLSGIVSAHVGFPVIFVELRCAAGQHTTCHFVGKPQQAWGDDDISALSRYEEENIHKDLLDVCEQLQLTRDRYQNLFEQSSVPIFIVDPDSGAFVDVNIEAHKLTSYPREQLLRMTLFDLCLPKEHYRILDQMKELIQSGTINDFDLTLVQKDGSSRNVVLSLKLLSIGNQRVIQTVMRDVTALKTAEEKEKELQQQLLRSERLSSIGHLAASVAHELKNPLGAIRNAVYYIKNALVNNPLLESDPHLSEILKLAESEIDGSVTIIGELLDFSRVVTIAPRKTSLNELAEELPSLVTAPSNVEWLWDLDPQIPTAIVDPERLRQVFTNIASNAIQAMPQGGKIRVQTRLEIETSSQSTQQTKFIVVSIEDTGTGIAARHLTKIFEPLFTTKARGTGLGLAISNNIVQKHGGVILVTSQEGKGTRFAIKLPLVPPPEKEE
jgi:PAS domain S-box-containing protein